MFRRHRPTVTDYNPSGRLIRTAKWWYAPSSVSKKTKIYSGAFLLVAIVAVVAGGLLLNVFGSDPIKVQKIKVAAPAVPPAAESPCPAQDPKIFSPETLINTSFETTWTRQGDMQVPSSKTGGPGLEKPFPGCFSRTPEGVLYSAANFASGLIVAMASGDQKAFYTARTSHSGNYSILMADLPSEPQVLNRPTVVFSGYRWNSYTPDTASIEIQYRLLTGPRSGTFTAITYTLAWENNDWLLVVPGKSDSVTVLADSQHTYIPWGGV